MNIAAKPTVYRGVEFKSRLEARFAEMLDKKKIDWVYEAETYIFGNYQPDFYLPFVGEHGLFIEIKPRMYIEELSMFWEKIWRAESAWICIDKSSSFREEWCLLQGNLHFRGRLQLVPSPVHVQFFREGQEQILKLEVNSAIFSR